MFSLYYNGIYDASASVINKYKKTLPYLTNRTKQDLVLFILTPGLFNDAYKLASDPGYQRVYIMFPSDDHLFLSDIVRLQNTLSEIKVSCQVVFPHRIKKYGNSTFWNNFIKRDHLLISSDDGVYHESFTGIRYMKTTKDNIYNFLVSIDTGGFLFANYLDDTMLDEYNSNGSIDQIHLPYTSTLYGGLTFKYLKENMEYRKKVRKIYCNRFVNTTEKNECDRRHGKLILSYYGEEVVGNAVI